jgi:hypothetical protein
MPSRDRSDAALDFGRAFARPTLGLTEAEIEGRDGRLC